jgi:hypothetical protein
MSRRKNPNDLTAPLIVVGGGLGLLGAAAYLLTRPTIGKHAEVGDVPDSPTLPPAGTPVIQKFFSGSASQSGSVDASIRRGETYTGDPAPYLMVAYTSRWDDATGAWSPYSIPTTFRGHVVSSTWTGKPIYSSPDDDLVEYLSDIAVSNSSIGFWLAYSLPITAEKADHTPTAYGQPGPWLSGRFGNLHGLNAADVFNLLRVLGWKTDGLVTAFQLLKLQPPTPGELVLA